MNASMVLKVMAKVAAMSMSVPETLVMICPRVKILLVLTSVSDAQLVTDLMDHNVSISTNVLLVLISVIVMPDVEIQKALTVAIAIPAILEMVEHVEMLMSVQQINTIVKTDIDALMQLVVSHAKTLMNVRPISIDVMQTLYAEILLELTTVPAELAIKVNLSNY